MRALNCVAHDDSNVPVLLLDEQCFPPNVSSHIAVARVSLKLYFTKCFCGGSGLDLELHCINAECDNAVCDEACAGDAGEDAVETCGGTWAMSVYKYAYGACSPALVQVQIL